MSLAEELLKNISVQPDPEGHIIIGGDRFITVPSNLKRLGVQYDHNMETVTFDCPRYWDQRDMSKMAVYINYMRADGYGDRYPVDNVQVDGDIMHFDWTISRNVTEVAGAISFLVCVMKTDGEGNEERHWNTELCQACYISPGMETEETAVDLYPDEVTQLLLRMASVERINVQAEEMRALYANTVNMAVAVEETKNQALDASNYIKNSYAPAIKGKVSGEIVRVDDVSPIEHDVNCYVHGKNLVDISAMVSTVASNNFVDNGDGTYTLTKISVGDSVKRFSAGDTLQKPIKANTEFRISCTVLENTTANGLCFILYDVNGEAVGYPSMTDIQRRSFSYNADIHSVRLYLLGTEQNDVYVTIRDLQIELGAVATAYEPYIDPTTVIVMARGKNVLNLSGYETHNGVTKTVNANGLITVTGTSTASININVGYGFMKAGYKYRPVIQKLKSDVAPSFWNFATSSNINKDKDGYISSDVDTVFSAFIYTSSAGTVYDSAFKVMVELVTDKMTDEYESYKGSEATPSSDGTCTITSKSPIMTLFTDTPGVKIEAEYNRDTTKMFESYVLTDEAKAEIAALVSKPAATISGNILVIK